MCVSECPAVLVASPFLLTRPLQEARSDCPVISMKLSTVLADIGVATPSALEGVIGNEFATATEAVKRAACTGAREVLNGPPPALFHPSKLHTSYFLYASQTRADFDDVPFKRGAWHIPYGCNIVGAVMMDVCKNVSCPALIYVERESPEHHGICELTVVVPEAPLAAMEAEFFFSPGPPSAFEQQWIGEGATTGKELRSRIGKYVQSRGGVLTPSWLLNGEEYYVTREGPLAMLRLRKATSDVEEAALQKMLSGFRWEDTRTRQLKHLMQTQSSNERVKLKTVFCRSKLSEATTEWKEINDAQIEDRGEMVDADVVLANAVLGSLALLILKHVESKDYYDVDTAVDSFAPNNSAQAEREEEAEGEAEAEAEAEGEADFETDANLQSVLSSVLYRESNVEVQALPPALRHSKDNAFALAIENTTRPCDFKKMASGNGMEAIGVLADTFFSLSDAQILKNELRATVSENGVHAALRSTGRMLNNRQGILCIFKDSEDTVINATQSLCLYNGEETRLTLDEVTRLVQLPWILPLVIGPSTGDVKVYELKLFGVAREKLVLSETSRVRAAHSHVASSAVPPELNTALSSLQTRLDSIETLLQQPLSVAPAQAVPAAPAAPAVPAAPVYTPDSPTTRALKRTIANIEAYEESQAAR